MNFIGRLAQRLERSVYTRKVVRSNRTVPTILHADFLTDGVSQNQLAVKLHFTYSGVLPFFRRHVPGL